jgi:hypothetical protein
MKDFSSEQDAGFQAVEKEEAEEFIDVVEVSRRHVEPPSNITAAVCFKTLFGDIDLGTVLQWVGRSAASMLVTL